MKKNLKILKKNFQVTRIISSSINNSLRSLRFYISKLNQEYKTWSICLWKFLSSDIDESDEIFWQPYGFSSAIKKIELSVGKISKTAKKINSDLYIIIYPWPGSLEHGQSKFNWEKFADNLCKKNSCSKLINFFPEFEKVKKSSKNWVNKLYIEDDVHLTNFGHQLIAKKILQETF